MHRVAARPTLLETVNGMGLRVAIPVEMVGSHDVLKKLKSHQALVLAAGLRFLPSRSRDWEDDRRQLAKQHGTRAQKNHFQC